MALRGIPTLMTAPLRNQLALSYGLLWTVLVVIGCGTVFNEGFVWLGVLH